MGAPGAKSVAAESLSGAKRAQPVRKRPAPAATKSVRDQLGREGDEFAVTLLVQQAARHADRLDAINAILSGDRTAWLEVSINGQVAEVRVSNLMVEERQRSAALQRILMDIHRMRAATPGVPKPPGGGGNPSNPIDRIQGSRNA